MTVPLQERIDQVAKLAIRYAGLGRKPNDKKKIAIILHNNPPDRANIGGAAGLDTPAYVYNMVEHLEKAGIKTDYRFDNGKDIIDRIIAGLSNDMSWSSKEEILERSVDTVKKTQYASWYNTFAPRVQKNLERYWGEPVGDFMAVEDQLLVPGILNGNVFIGLQPPRAFEEKQRRCTTTRISRVPTSILLFIVG